MLGLGLGPGILELEQVLAVDRLVAVVDKLVVEQLVDSLAKLVAMEQLLRLDLVQSLLASSSLHLGSIWCLVRIA